MVPAADIHRQTPSPYLPARVPARVGAAVAPKISPTSVTNPIAVAEKRAGTLSVGTSTIIKAGMH
jgi:hypothetical protein